MLFLVLKLPHTHHSHQLVVMNFINQSECFLFRCWKRLLANTLTNCCFVQIQLNYRQVLAFIIACELITTSKKITNIHIQSYTHLPSPANQRLKPETRWQHERANSYNGNISWEISCILLLWPKMTAFSSRLNFPLLVTKSILSGDIADLFFFMPFIWLWREKCRWPFGLARIFIGILFYDLKIGYCCWTHKTGWRRQQRWRSIDWRDSFKDCIQVLVVLCIDTDFFTAFFFLYLKIAVFILSSVSFHSNSSHWTREFYCDYLR